jgi:dTDP-L-rhamnose 4-epimerase
MGFIGLHAAQLFVDNGFEVVLLDNLSEQIHGAVPCLVNPVLRSPKVSCVRRDVRNRQDWLFALEGVSTVLHLAAETGTGQSMHKIDLYTSTNVGGTALLLDILANQKHSVSKIVLASSRAVYGEGPYDCSRCGRVYPTMRTDAAMRAGKWEVTCPGCSGDVALVPTSEDAQIRPVSIYASTKLAQENLVRVAGDALGLPTVILRFQNVYGEWQSLKNPYTGILSIFATKLRQHQPIYLYEDGQESRDFVHVEDVTRAIFLAATSNGGDGKILNVGTGASTSIATIARMLKDCFGNSSATEISGEYRIGDIRHCYADLTSIQTCLGFRPEIDIGAGIARFVRWVETQPIEPDRLHIATQELSDRGLMGQSK